MAVRRGAVNMDGREGTEMLGTKMETAALLWRELTPPRTSPTTSLRPKAPRKLTIIRV